MNIKILGTKILIEIPEAEEALSKSPGGIFVPQSETTRENVKLTTVIQAGNKCEEVKNGDKVYFDIRMISPITIESEKYFIVDESSIIGIQE